MEETVVKAAMNGGIALLTLAVVGVFIAKWLIPFAERMFDTHRDTIQSLVGDGQVRQSQLVETFRESALQQAAAHTRTVEAVVQGIGRDVSAIRADIDRVADAVAGSLSGPGSGPGNGVITSRHRRTTPFRGTAHEGEFPADIARQATRIPQGTGDREP